MIIMGLCIRVVRISLSSGKAEIIKIWIREREREIGGEERERESKRERERE